MPRGRAGLTMIPPEDVRAVLLPGYPSRYGRALRVKRAAEFFDVNERTVRRWMERGLPLHYGRNFVTPESWATFCLSTSPGNCRSTPVRQSGPERRTGLDPNVSARIRAGKSR